MLKKSFVSLSFASSKKIQVLQLTSSRKSVKKHISVDLPEGLIHNLKVASEEALAKVIKEVWKKAGFKEKAVGIIIPESSTFSKILTFPKLAHQELDEAIRWQAYEYLPHQPENWILDWKIIKEEKNEIHILIVAILKEALRGYVRAAHLAGLFPLVVETPSLSLVRLAGEGEKGGLVIYGGISQAIILIFVGQSIIGSSVVGVENQDEILQTTSRMLKHYKDVSVERIVIGGPKISKEVATNLQTTLGKQVSWIKSVVGGIEANAFQEYIIPISLQLKDPAEPADETTVNLLPPELVKKYEREKLQHQIWILSLFVTLVVWISFFTTFGVYLFLGQQITSIKKEDVLDKIPPEKAQYITQVGEINEVADKVLVISDVSVSPQVIFNAISDAKPEEVSIVRYRINMESGSIEILGISATRQALIAFKQKLEENKGFSLVQIPISSFEQESNLEYSMVFSYLPISGIKIRR